MPNRLVLLLAALAALAPACGHRGDPLPPRRRTPPAPHDFRLAQRGNALEVRATAPLASVDGVAYEALTVEFLYAEGLKDLEKAGRRHAARAVPGRRVVEALPLPAPGTILRAAARGVAGGEKGARTLTLSLVTQAPLQAPAGLSAALAQDGVALSWHGVRPKAVAPPTPASGLPAVPGGPLPTGPRTTAPSPAVPPPAEPPVPAQPPAAGARAGSEPVAEGEATPEGPRRNGFLVYRRLGGTAFGEPLVGEPLEQRSLLDPGAPQGATACYVVRAVASTEPLVESAPSNEACVEVRDIAPPAAPAGLAVLPREGGLEVLWGPSADADVAGYRVYRTTPPAPRERVAEVGTNRSAWLDETARRGVAYAYTVTAFDQAGNESAPAEPVEASLP
jgi:hypothetical protein